MYAIIETGGKQIKVTEGEEIKVERLDPSKDGKIYFENVLLIAEGDAVSVGQPYVQNAKVEATYLDDEKAKKVIAFKFRRRKRSKTKKGHRQVYSRVRIEKIIK